MKSLYSHGGEMLGVLKYDFGPFVLSDSAGLGLFRYSPLLHFYGRSFKKKVLHLGYYPSERAAYEGTTLDVA